MLNLKDLKSSYMVISGNVNAITSYLYSRDYNVIDIKSYYNESFEDSIIAFSNSSNDELRRDAIHIMDYFDQRNLIIKYKDVSSVSKIFENGSELEIGVLLYNTDSDNKSYIYEGISFSFVDKQLYYFPSKKEDFKSGMIVEYLSNNKWIEKKVIDPNIEFNKIYELMMKYNKIRIPI